jgi:hypothetical protein
MQVSSPEEEEREQVGTGYPYMAQKHGIAAWRQLR